MFFRQSGLIRFDPVRLNSTAFSGCEACTFARRSHSELS